MALVGTCWFKGSAIVAIFGSAVHDRSAGVQVVISGCEKHCTRLDDIFTTKSKHTFKHDLDAMASVLNESPGTAVEVGIDSSVLYQFGNNLVVLKQFPRELGISGQFRNLPEHVVTPALAPCRDARSSMTFGASAHKQVGKAACNHTVIHIAT